MSLYTLFRLLTTGGKIIVKQDYYLHHLLSILPQATDFKEKTITINQFSSSKLYWKLSSIISLPFCTGEKEWKKNAITHVINAFGVWNQLSINPSLMIINYILTCKCMKILTLAVNTKCSWTALLLCAWSKLWKCSMHWDKQNGHHFADTIFNFFFVCLNCTNFTRVVEVQMRIYQHWFSYWLTVNILMGISIPGKTLFIL